jgi:hypothetical protein
MLIMNADDSGNGRDELLNGRDERALIPTVTDSTDEQELVPTG